VKDIRIEVDSVRPGHAAAHDVARRLAGIGRISQSFDERSVKRLREVELANDIIGDEEASPASARVEPRSDDHHGRL
jgi:hypothetical protein